ncbi:M48 family metallopeptidase [Glaciecola sp. MF2-115]|uniref:M48 family metallopeptidase n=1 Tax=Glaciecola sp. MF2-115 TaxID=3384827 RepID=UPI0039A3B1BD
MSKISNATDIKTPTTNTGVLLYGGKHIPYEIIRRTVSTKSNKVVIKVHPDQRVVATAPAHTSDESIDNAITKRARWVWNNIQEFAAQNEHVLPKRYVSGETQFYLGKRYVLKILSDQDEQQGKAGQVKLTRGRFVVTLPTATNDRGASTKYLLEQWYIYRAKYIFRERLNYMLQKATWVDGLPSFRVMTMKTQWGSCSTKGNLMLNPHLVKAPKECIDYVILHELCHIAEHNHSEKFWRLLTQVMPEWKGLKSRLDGMAEQYLNS